MTRGRLSVLPSGVLSASAAYRRRSTRGRSALAVYTPNRDPSDAPEAEPPETPSPKPLESLSSPEDEVERQLRLAKQRASLWFRRLWPVSVALVLLLWLGSGVYVVQPGEVGVIRTFGLETG